MTDETNHARDQAKAQLEGIMEGMAALELLRDGEEAVEYDGETYKDEDNLREVLEQEALEVSTRACEWVQPGGDSDPSEYRILLCTGGPAVQITGGLGSFNEPDSAVIEYQAWFTPWVAYPTSHDEKQGLLRYAQLFYFGE